MPWPAATTSRRRISSTALDIADGGTNDMLADAIYTVERELEREIEGEEPV